MAVSSLVEWIFKWLLIASLATLAATWLLKDRLPDPSYYDSDFLDDPVQRRTALRPFVTRVNGQEYHIEPKFNYELHGVVVSYHDADSFTDIWHHDKWKDYLNLRDLCVIWGDNVDSGVYQAMGFSNDSWTCWFSWTDRETGQQFAWDQLSNNHLLTDDTDLQSALMSAAPGDVIRLKGVLAAYANPGNNFQRGTSTVRTDTGNGACETIFLQEFEVLKSANSGLRLAFELSKWVLLVSLIGFLVMIFIAPARNPLVR
ncbi:MAG: hypothetical protein JSW10_02420 [Pseudomonadota bacterium]|nr:MAG: hypothetical protein JSW10_02420 [Pseudomonadota bacterium]